MSVDLKQLLSDLSNQDNGGFVYRGQTGEYKLPLVPSLFRPMVTDAVRFQNRSAPVVRRVADAYFVPTLQPSEVQARLREEQLAEYSKRFSVQDALIKLFGYPLAQILAQQAGLGSEGLDVTRNLKVAGFFATHQYDVAHDEYRLATEGIGVIYRWPIKPTSLCLQDLKVLDYYSCPPYLPSEQILATFGESENYPDAMISLLRFLMRKTGARLEPPGVAEAHPFTELRLPSYALSTSRIYRQSAGLLIPDQILSQDWTSEMLRNRASDQAVGNGRMCVEDLAISRGVEVWRFAHHSRNADCVSVKADAVFPRHDISCLMVRDCLNFLRWAERYGFVGGVTLLGNDPSNLRFIWDDFLMEGIPEDRMVERLIL